MRSRGTPAAPPPPLALAFRDGRRATLALTPHSTVLAVDDAWVSSWDLGGRPYALARGELTWRRALDGRWLVKGRDAAGARVRALVAAARGDPALAAARAEARAALEALRAAGADDDHACEQAGRRLDGILAMDVDALAADVRRFAAVYSPVGILPPDQYLSLVVQATEGCSWNACTFCELYRGVPFRVRAPDEFARHVEAARAYFGPALSLRRALFLGAANALCVAHERLLPLFDALGRAFELPPADLPASKRASFLRERPRAMGGVASFVDAWTGHRKTASQYADYAARGLRRVYVGLESGDSELLAYLGKPGTPGDAVELVEALHVAGVAVGMIVLIGAGGERFFAAHVERTASVLRDMRLGPDDLLYYSELVAPADGGPVVERPPWGHIPLDAGRRAAQRDAIVTRLRAGAAAHEPGPRVAVYDIREFAY